MFKKILFAFLLFLVALIVAAAWYLSQRPKPPLSQAFINGTVITMEDELPIAEAIYIEGEQIKFVGSEQQVMQRISKHSLVHDLKGQTLMPGFIDAHGHFPGTALATINVDINSPPIGSTENIAQLLQALSKKAKDTAKGDWVIGVGYDDTMLAEKRHPSRAELDRAVPNRPVFLWHISAHMGVANSAALALAGIDDNTPDPEGGHFGRNADGTLNGFLEENALEAVQILAFDLSVSDGFSMMKIAAEEYAKAGVTTAQSGAIDDALSQGLWLGSLLNIVPMRLELWPLYNDWGQKLLQGDDEAARLSNDKVHVGAIKIIADGSIQGYTGYLTQPYHVPFKDDKAYRGYPRLPRDTLFKTVAEFHRAGFQLAIHGNGDASIDDILDAVAAAQKEQPRADSRHILIHAQMARQDQLERMQALGVTPSFFVAHTYYWGDRHRDIFMGPERAARMSPARSAMDAGLRFSLHLDAPVVPMQPLTLVWTAVNRLSSSGKVIGANERIPVMQALKAVTIDAAWQVFQEQNRGSIRAGKYADLVVLSANPLLQPDTIKDIQVTRTLVGGVSIFDASSSNEKH